MGGTLFAIPRVYMAYATKVDLNLLDPRVKLKERRKELVEELNKIQVSPNDSSKELKIGHKLPPSIRSQPIKSLQQNLNIFAWSYKDIKRIDPGITCYKLNIDHSIRLKQRRCPLNSERYRALNKELQKLLNNEFTHEAKYLKWIANPMLVKKNNED